MLRTLVVAASSLTLAACAGVAAHPQTTGAGGSSSSSGRSGAGGQGVGGGGPGTGGAGTGVGGMTMTDGGVNPDTRPADGGDATTGAPVPPIFLPIFGDRLTDGFSFVPFGGATNATSIDTVDPHGGTAAFRVEVPSTGYTGGAVVSGVFIDLSPYNAVTFWARSSVATSLNVVGLGNNGTTTTYAAEWNAVPLTTTWTRYAVPIPLPSKLSTVTGLFHFAEGSDEGAHTIWFDDIQYETLAPSILGPARPAIAGETLSKQTGDRFAVDGPSVTFAVNGGNQTVATARSYFTFATSDAAVATVDDAGLISAVGVGHATISAMLGAIAAAGGIAVDVVAATAPTAAAPTPQAPAAGVVSLLSGVYTDRPVDTWSASYDLADVTALAIAGVPTQQLTNLTFAGIEFFAAPTGPVDATTMAAFHLDVWTPTASRLQVKLVDFGANAAYAGGDDSESTVTFDAASTPPLTLDTWIGLEIPLASFTGLTARAHLAQLLLTTNPGSTLFVENVYFHP